MPLKFSRRAFFYTATVLPYLQAARQTISKAAPKTTTPPPPAEPAAPALPKEDEALLEEIEKANFQFFWEQADPNSGLVKDRCHVRADDHTLVASIAATGFGLTAL